MDIHLVDTDKCIADCYSVMSELRPHVSESEFVCRVRRQQASGYRLAAGEDHGMIVAVAGFRIGENLAWGRFLYVDDLVAREGQRSKGYGTEFLCWLRDYAVTEGCHQLHLDSGIQRADAHRFYERQGMSKGGFHFAEKLVPDEALQPMSHGDGGLCG